MFEGFSKLQSTLLLVVSTIIAIKLLKYLYSYFRRTYFLLQIPGTREAYPIIGDFFKIVRADIRTHEFTNLFFTYMCDNDEGIVRNTTLHWHRVMLYKAEYMKAVMNNKVIDKADLYDLAEEWLGPSLLITTGEKWHKKRKILTPAFHYDILEDFMNVYNDQAKICVSKLYEHLEKPQDIYSKILMCSLDVVVEAAMGRKLGAQHNHAKDYASSVTEIGHVWVERLWVPYLRVNWMFKLSKQYKPYKKCLKILLDFADETIKQRKELRKTLKKVNPVVSEFKGKNKRLAILDLLLQMQEEGYEITDQDIKDEVNTFVFAGHDTTATSMTFAIWLLGNYPEKQKLVQKELDSIFGNSDRPATSKDLKQMTYLECAIKESLRLYPPVNSVHKKANFDLHIGKYTIPANTTVTCSLYKLHRDQEVFPDPEKFQPERFFPENSQGRHPFAYLPFSGGPRNCIGQRFALLEEKVVLSTIFRKLRAVSAINQDKLRLKMAPILTPESNILEVTFFKRNQK